MHIDGAENSACQNEGERRPGCGARFQQDFADGAGRWRGERRAAVQELREAVHLRLCLQIPQLLPGNLACTFEEVDWSWTVPSEDCVNPSEKRTPARFIPQVFRGGSQRAVGQRETGYPF